MGYSQRHERGDHRWVPDTSGVYRLYRGDQVVYVGQTNNLRARLAEHDTGKTHWGSFDYKSTRGVPTAERKRIEKRAIAYNHPTRNRK